MDGYSKDFNIINYMNMWDRSAVLYNCTTAFDDNGCYVVSYNTGDSANGFNSNVYSTSTLFNEGNFAIVDPTRVGYTFGGWYTSSSFEEESKVTVALIEVGDNTTLYAKWVIIE